MTEAVIIAEVVIGHQVLLWRATPDQEPDRQVTSQELRLTLRELALLIEMTQGRHTDQAETLIPEVAMAHAAEAVTAGHLAASDDLAEAVQVVVLEGLAVAEAVHQAVEAVVVTQVEVVDLAEAQVEDHHLAEADLVEEEETN